MAIIWSRVSLVRHYPRPVPVGFKPAVMALRVRKKPPLSELAVRKGLVVNFNSRFRSLHLIGPGDLPANAAEYKQRISVTTEIISLYFEGEGWCPHKED